MPCITAEQTLANIEPIPAPAATPTTKQHFLSPMPVLPARRLQTFLNCGPLRNLSNGCNGGDVPDVLSYMSKWGLPDETCL